jgi:osmotically-inducible protein OsmY
MKTDQEIQKDVSEELKWEPSVNATHIGVEVRDGVVTLAGHVESYTEKWHAERAAQRVAGVKALAVEMEVKLPGSAQRNDADIARSVENVLEWSSYAPAGSIQVMVEKGWVTLTGKVQWEFERHGATEAVHHLLGVTGVSDQITIKQMVSPAVVKAGIEAALKRRAHADAQVIAVEVKGSDVILSGTAHTWAERDLANNAAWGAPGVTSVVDRITLAF